MLPADLHSNTRPEVFDRGTPLSEEVPSLLLLFLLWRLPMLGFRSRHSLGRRLLWLLGIPARRVQAHPRHTGCRRSRGSSRCRGGLLFKEMRRGLWRWSFRWQIEPSLIDAQIANLSQEQAWGEHVRCHEVDVFAVALGYLITCARF